MEAGQSQIKKKPKHSKITFHPTENTARTQELLSCEGEDLDIIPIIAKEIADENNKNVKSKKLLAITL